MKRIAFAIAFFLAGTLPCAADDAHELAKKLSNPAASLISVPFQLNYDDHIGPERDGHRFTLNFQPVVPVALGADWNVIIRTIVPIVDQDDIFPTAGDQLGLGDTLQSFFFTPKAPGPGGLVWALGPALLYPTGTDSMLGGEKWAAGPTGLLLIQNEGWTVGVLANHLWDYAGDRARADVSSTFIQPFISYNTKDAWTYSLNTESSYDWTADQWSVPINVSISKLTKLGHQPVSIGGGLKYWAESPDSGPHDLSGRLTFTFLFPEGG